MISNNDVVLVDEQDKPLGTREKVAAHLGKGTLHRAISAWIIKVKSLEDENVEILITKRSDKKMLWPGFWSNAVCSHPKEGESYEQAGERRVFEELGIKTKFKLLYTLVYRAEYKDTGTEHELTGVLVGKSDEELKPHPDEVSDYRWVTWEELVKWSEREKEQFTPWSLMMIGDGRLAEGWRQL